ncbi:MAG: helix-turn-helix domain-containing protein [Candidatus Uhrbacteria bacterium]|nr:hypothetical protein [Patescibacteria group bacterium]MBU1906604.1 hypothetical protein [Patescibacteria group bacterium]
MDEALHKTLTLNGFTDKQARVYLALLEIDHGTASQIAEQADLKRPIVYVILKDLMKRGFVIELNHSQVKRYSVVDPMRILQTVQSNVEDLGLMIPLMRRMHKPGEEKPKIEVFEGADGVISVFKTFGSAKVSRYVSTYKRLMEIMPYEVERWIRAAESGKTKTDTRQLIVDEPEGREFAEKITADCQAWQVRLLPPQMGVDCDFALVEDVVAITHFNPLYIIVIHSASIAQSLEPLFDVVWHCSKPCPEVN